MAFLSGDSLASAWVPRAVVALSCVTIAISAILMIVGTSHVGVTWDERIHAVMLEEYFSSGWYASPDWLVNGNPDAFLGKWPYYVYAPVAALVGHVFAFTSGSEQWGGFSDSASAYAARHLSASFLALLGIFASGLIVRVVTRSWRWAILGMGLLSSVPMWIGHGMFNGKDLPVATGYTIATLGLIVMLTRSYTESWRTRALAIGCTALGLVLAVGTRPASGLPAALTAFGMLALFAVIGLRSKRGPRLLSSPGRRSLDVVLGLGLGYLVLAMLYPKGFINPFTLAKESLLISGRFPVNDRVLTNGTWLSQPPPWFYLPEWFGFQLPLLTLIGCLGFLIYWIWNVIRAVVSRSSRSSRELLLVTPVVAQLLLLPLLAVAVHSTMYNAVRQFLFVVPAATILAVLGIRQIFQALSRGETPYRIARPILWVLVSIGIALPVADSVRLFPYTYAYFNELSAVQGINGRWATDYWRASSQELTSRIPAVGAVTCRLPIDGKPISDCTLEAPYVPFLNLRGTDALPGALAQGEFWFARENNGDVSTPPGCNLHDALTRQLRGEAVIIAQVFRCGPAAL